MPSPFHHHNEKGGSQVYPDPQAIKLHTPIY